MNAGAGISILDTYEWLPGYGENSISIESKGVDLVIRVEYDVEGRVQEACYRELRFNMTCAFSRTVFPGIPIFNTDYNSNVNTPAMGALIEYPDSEAARAWEIHFGGYRNVKHYKIAFLSENVLVEVFAENMMLSDEVFI